MVIVIIEDSSVRIGYRERGRRVEGVVTRKINLALLIYWGVVDMGWYLTASDGSQIALELG